MKTTIQLLPLAVGVALLQACGTMDQRNCDTQPAAKVDTVTPVAATQAPTAATRAIPANATTHATTTPVAAPVVVPLQEAAAATSAAPVAESPAAPLAPAASAYVDRYTVAPGDTLAGIAARKEVYGDLRLWPLLYRDNVQQIGPRGVIFPNQILTVGRNHSIEEINALLTRPKRTTPPTMAATATSKPLSPAAEGSAAAPAPAPAPEVAVAPPASAPVATPPAAAIAEAKPEMKQAEAKVAEAKPAEAKPAEAKPADVKPMIAAIPVAAPAGEAPKGSPAAGGATGGQPADYLAAARRAASVGDVPWATYYYSVYLAQKRDDANAWGELGNVYYFDGNPPDAARAYYNAANLLIDRGQTVRALSLVQAIEEGDPALSSALYERLTGVRR